MLVTISIDATIWKLYQSIYHKAQELFKPTVRAVLPRAFPLLRKTSLLPVTDSHGYVCPLFPLSPTFLFIIIIFFFFALEKATKPPCCTYNSTVSQSASGPPLFLSLLRFLLIWRTIFRRLNPPSTSSYPLKRILYIILLF